MVAAVVGIAGGQKLKNKIIIVYVQAVMLTAIPKKPGTLKGPQESSMVPESSELGSEVDFMNPLQRRQKSRVQ